VHEKNVLLPLLPMTFMLGHSGGMLPETRTWVGLANVLGCWTMFPLLARDGLRIPYAVLTLLWSFLLSLPPASIASYASGIPGAVALPVKIVHLAIYVAMLSWHAIEHFVPPPADKPDLWVVLNVLVGATGFGLCYLWCLWSLVRQSGFLGQNGAELTVDAKGKEKAKAL
jgi:alpha-1,3-glucosyltransferase